MKEIYSFEVELEKEVEKKTEKVIIDKDTKKEKKVSVNEKVIEKEPVRIILKEPNRRQIEEADMEYSIEMSQCVKRGILTKAMLAKKYSDSGGLLAEEDAKLLTSKYADLSKLQTDFTRLNTKTTKKKPKEDETKEAEIIGKIAEVRREIVNMETAYASLFNHTADTKAQNRVILWYVLYLTYTMRGEEDPEEFFPGETFEEKEQAYYDLDEANDELYGLIQGKIATFISYWYFTAGVTKEDLTQLDKDIEEGNI
jgi:hypothetical protein